MSKNDWDEFDSERLFIVLCPPMPFINAIGHALCLDARPHKATLGAPSFCVYQATYTKGEKIFIWHWHTCAPHGSDRKREYKESVADSVSRLGYCFN